MRWVLPILFLCACAVAGGLIGILAPLRSDRHPTKVSTKTNNNVVRLDATAVQGWLRASSPEALRNVVLGLIGLEDARARQLTRSEPNVNEIIDIPYHQARDCLASALRVGLDTDKGKKYLDESIRDFQHAARNYTAMVAPRRESWACLHLCLVYTALDNILGAQKWGARGYDAAIEWAREEIRAFMDRRELQRGRWSLLGWSWAYPVLVGAIVVITREGFSTDIWKDWQEAVITSGAGYLAFVGLAMTFGPDCYRVFVAWRAKALMKDCDQFLNELWKIWSSLSETPAEVTSYRVLRIDDPGMDSGLFRMTYVLCSTAPPRR